MKCLAKKLFVYLIAAYGFIETQAIDTVTTVPTNVKQILKNANVSEVKRILNGSRRILIGSEATTNRPYMVYLKLPVNNPKYQDYRRWLCGGVIIHEEYILTSAACIEDAKHFYVVSGTYKHDENEDRYNNMCIKNGAKKAVWKCIPRNYVFDGHENDNIRWMNNDIAVVKVEDEFDFTRRIRGCDFVPRPICYNNQTQRLEEPGNEASIAGWGSTAMYNDANTATQNLLESEVKIISKVRCKKRWGKRYHNIIENYMICSKDIVPDMTEICQEKYVDCTDIMYSEESGEEGRRVLSPSELVLHSAYHNESGRRVAQPSSGGFCENDHGGPLVHGTGVQAVVIGIISACLVKEQTNQCYGPFLYTSVYKNRNLISCAIYRDIATDCDKLFRTSITHTETEMSWVDHPDGPAKNELLKMRRKHEEDMVMANKTNTTVESLAIKTNLTVESIVNNNLTTKEKITTNTSINKDTTLNVDKELDKSNATQDLTFEDVLTSDKVEQHEGVIVRLFNSSQAKPSVKKLSNMEMEMIKNTTNSTGN